MSHGRDERDLPTDVEPPRENEEPYSSDALRAERGGWIDSLRRNQPVLYAARHLIKPVVQILVAIVGIGALLRTLLPRIDVDLEWLDSWGRENLSWVPDPLGWTARWLGDRLGAIEVADWIGTVLRNAKWWLPILVAIVVGIGEVLRRWEAASTPDDPGPAEGDEAENESVSDPGGHPNVPQESGEREGSP